MKLAQMENATRQLTDAQFGSLIRACLGFRLRGEAYTGGECLLRKVADAWTKGLNGEQEGF